MLVRMRVMTWGRVGKSLQALLAHGLLFSFTLLLVLKIDRVVPYSWWIIFSPLWLFHGVVARGRFSLPAPSMPHDRHWAPCHAIMGTPLLVAFEILLCIHLESSYAINLKIVFLPLLAFEVAILIDNIRMCRILLPVDDENMSDEAIFETLPHFWIMASMVFFIAATVFTLLKISGEVATLGWWDLYINFGIGECFAFLSSAKWYNPRIHGDITESSSLFVRYQDRGSSLDWQQSGLCNLQNIGGHIMKILFIGFQILLILHLEGSPATARNMPLQTVFSPLFLLQGAAVLFAAYRLAEKLVLLLYDGEISARYSAVASKAHDCFGFLDHGSRLLGWWSIDETSREEQARIYYDGNSKYNTFSPDMVKKMPRAVLAEEICRLQAALTEQTDVTKFSQQQYERLQNEKILCRVCFEEQINVVLLPCRHHIICSACCEKCKRCPVCRVCIEKAMPVYDL
ncbi:uncharacterized protein LOC129311250 [Prosopis cineraria]|uniref:uncharacterized protein LOC129311250 n=1 Tax=Prosopis cineraria TaxID=364024 RepID=UPI0024106AF7|nr:uncharacterized protein LOC129311250 [Prosopis cineraria]